MVVPSNRRSFLATLRNVALAAGVCSPAIAQAKDNPNGLPVIRFDDQQTPIIDGIIFDLKYEDVKNELCHPLSLDTNEILCSNETARSSTYFVKVWVPVSTPIVVGSFQDNAILYGEIVLFRHVYVLKTPTMEYKYDHHRLIRTKNTDHIVAYKMSKNMEYRNGRLVQSS